MSDRPDKSVWLTRAEMLELCPSCADEMAEKRITKLKVMNSDGQFVETLKAGFSQGLCDKFGDATGFRTRCMSAMSGKVDDEGAFCNALKIKCHGSAGAEGKRARIITKDEKRRYTLGVVYEPDTLDTDQELSTAEELEKACWDFMRLIQGRSEAAAAALKVLGEISEATKNGDEIQLELSEDLDEIVKRGVNGMHVEDLEGSEVVECYIAPVDFELDGEQVKKGSWLAGIVWDADSFAKIESGEWTGYSMGGWAKKENADG